MYFTKVNHNEDLFNNILKNSINYEQIEYFKTLINYDFISISGSSILQILQEELYPNSDLDIYIEINSINQSKLQIINKLITFLGNLYQYSRQIITNYNDQIYNYYIYKTNSINTNNNTYANNNVTNTHYSSLKKYIKFYQLFQYQNRKIELIFIRTDIETLLLNTFDYDIVKNYWKENSIYSFNIHSIKHKTATMTLKHFINRIILGTPKEFRNFINRYSKYLSRDYKIFIHKTYISTSLFNHILKMYVNNNYDNLKTRKSEFNVQIIKHNYFLYFGLSYYNINLFINNKDIIFGEKAKCDLSYYNNKINYLVYSSTLYILKYILINGVIQNYIARKKLNNYSYKLLKLYMNPDSESLHYKIQNWDNNNNEQDNSTKITYITSNNKLQIFKLK